ncbi:MAG: TFIIB-type zinc finger domain-containing protein [Prevotella sp.]|nr:TFIIB-type zinc finger domain-containing protein [Prevotella sp.]
MKALKCEMCGSTNLIKEGGVFVCQSCGTKYSVEEAKKMMVEGTVDVKGTVKVDTSDELKNLYEIARRNKDNNNEENAMKYYDMILVKDPKSWEANFYVVYFKSMSCKIAQIQSAAIDVNNCLGSVLELVKDNVTDSDEQKKVINEIFIRTSTISRLLHNGAKNHYEGIDAEIRSNYTQEYIYNVAASKDIMYNLGDYLIQYFGDTYGSLAAESWKQGIDQHKVYVKHLAQKDVNVNQINEYAEKVKKYDSSYQKPTVDTSGCYVATAVYGSYDCPEVWTLRRFRDFTLDETWYGRLFIKTYYTVSPTFVKYFGNVKMFKSQGKKLLDRLVSKLNKRGYDNTPYKDKY